MRVAVAIASLVSVSRADDTPSAERLRSAAEEYDAGRRAYLAKDYTTAASHFENAFHDAPRAEALRNAIRARRGAKEPARAATLAALAKASYPHDHVTSALAEETLRELRPKLHEVNLTCEPDCEVAADGRVVSLARVSSFVFFLDPGEHAVVVSFRGEQTRSVSVTARANDSTSLALDAPKEPEKAALPPVDATTAASATTASTAAPPAEAPKVAEPPATAPRDDGRAARKPLAPWVFYAAAGLTVAAAGVTTWSGIDTLNNPGKDAVRSRCVGLSESCPTYQDGLSAQRRTNILLGATAAVGIGAAIVGIFFTDWSDRSKARARLDVGIGALELSGQF